MKIKRKLIEEQTLDAFAEKENLTLVISERDTKWTTFTKAKFYCSFEHTDILDGSTLVGITGNGNTEEEAIEDYTKQISENILVFRDKDFRKEIKVPRLI